MRIILVSRVLYLFAGFYIHLTNTKDFSLCVLLLVALTLDFIIQVIKSYSIGHNSEETAYARDFD